MCTGCRRISFLLLLCSALLACDDSSGRPDAPSPSPTSPVADAGTASEVTNVASQPVTFACDEGASAEPGALRRLTMTQYKNTLRDLVHWLVGDAARAERALRELDFERLPLDRREPTPQDPHGGYRRLDQAVDQSHVDETLRVATALGNALTTPERLASVAGACANDADAGNDESCVSMFIRRFGARALRRPLDLEDERFYRVVFGGEPSAAGYADLITVMLSSPDFLYFVEHGAAELPEQAGSYQLSAHELASRLSYHLWQTLPDDELWRTAEDGSLLRAEVLRQQVARLMADERTRVTMAEMFSDWLRLDAVPVFDARSEDPLYAAFAGKDLPGPTLQQHVVDDALDMLGYYTWHEPLGLEALLTSELSFARDQDLARIYGVEPWDGSTRPPSFPAGTRPGLLTRAWFLASGSANTRPIMRGTFIRHALLCDELAPPPSNVNAVPPALSAAKTTRRVVEELTEQPGTACASCHTSLINPLGFAFEGFDALGRARSEQLLFAPDGEQTGALQVDTSSVPRITMEDERATRGPAELVQRMLQSGKLEACFARNYFRFTFGRREDLARDGCALERLRARLAETGRIRDMLEEAALLPALQQRRFEP
jgi:hypothetical protein